MSARISSVPKSLLGWLVILIGWVIPPFPFGSFFDSIFEKGSLRRAYRYLQLAQNKVVLWSFLSFPYESLEARARKNRKGGKSSTAMVIFNSI